MPWQFVAVIHVTLCRGQYSWIAYQEPRSRGFFDLRTGQVKNNQSDIIYFMHKKPMFKEMFVTLLLIWVLHLLGIYLYLYWLFNWYDIVLHFLGGVWVSLIIIWILSILEVQDKKMFFYVLLSIIIIGFSWEIFEYLTGITGPTFIELIDTIKDLLNDTLGALIGFVYYTKKKRLP